MMKTRHQQSDSLSVPVLAHNVTFDWTSSLDMPPSYLCCRFIEILQKKKIEMNLEKEMSCLT